VIDSESRTLYEKSQAGRRAVRFPSCDVPQTDLPRDRINVHNGLPELSELDIARHYQELAARSFGVESGFYPLGSCTMKYNPKVGERVAHDEILQSSHPLQDPATVQGCLAIMFELQGWLAEIGGFASVSLQPAAGAHGEFSALTMIRHWHRDRGEPERDEILIPDSAHGTNPASATMAGYTTIEIPSDDRGNVDIAALSAMCSAKTAALMITNPNTLGLFDENVEQAVGVVHSVGGLVYGDGANMNALTGILKPADVGIDLMHYNLHKTFATPHGGGGPGAGPLAATAELASYLPGWIVENSNGASRVQFRLVKPERSIGSVAAHFGNMGNLLRAVVYLKLLGASGLRHNAECAVLNANYLKKKLEGVLPIPFQRRCMHEFVCSASTEKDGLRAIDICKRLMDFGVHPPTNYFPLIVREALMIEPTETESMQTLDAFADAIATIVEEATSNPKVIANAPHRTPVGRLDETLAARELNVTDSALPKHDHS